ncbi:cyclic nucleotide-gated cation channel [Klebsormidium nitens]|uniref:Cyclic nucleotide-gated cation channel n=1 Tax=Klebsormidium nitens TaxID=105231 RepID=A0A1Y1HS66_KLENI|nr:cyclic nucleotide-gated cation channel [Klebsormidium nitens]|eukprot:GAQ80019.1 cyclic nucleotide-gated cation channel [Klebsormidium nitens]
MQELETPLSPSDMMEPAKGPLKFVRFEPQELQEPRYQRRQPEPVDPRAPLPPRPFFPTASPQANAPQNGPRVAPFSLEDPTASPPSRSFRSWPTFTSRQVDSRRIFAEELNWRKSGVFDPHGKLIRQWNKVFVIACLVAAAVDPLFFFLVEVDLDRRCMQIERSFAVTVTVLRCVTDLVYFLQMLLQFRVAYTEPSSRIFGRGELVVDKESIAKHYLQGNFALDFFAWLPIPQFVLWAIIPNFKQPGTASAAKNGLRFVVILQYIPRIVRLVPIQSSLQRPGTLAFETASSGFVINLLVFLLASHVIAAIWYLLGVERVDHCWRQVCASEAAINCNTDFFDCSSVGEPGRMAWSAATKVTDLCVDQSMEIGGFFNYGIYQPILKIVATLGVKRYFYSLWWGLKNLTSMGQPLIPSTFTGELWFCIIIALTGMLLLAMLVGNMQKYLQSLGRRVEDHRTMLRDTEAWMKHRQLPTDLRKRIRQFDRFKWGAMHGVDEEKLLEALPEDLARDIKRHLCLDLVKKTEANEKKMLEALPKDLARKIKRHLRLDLVKKVSFKIAGTSDTGVLGFDFEELRENVFGADWEKVLKALPEYLARHLCLDLVKKVGSLLVAVSEIGAAGSSADLERDIKRHLCIDLVKKVPLFERLDYLVLDAICERLKPQLFIRGSCIIRQGDPAFRMLFVIRGTLQSVEYKRGQSNTLVDTVTLTSGDFVGDELLTWCLDPRPKQYYPSSPRTVVTDSQVEAFSLSADDLRYVTGHFLRNTHRMELRRALRFYSPHWRIWGALAIQAAWRRYKQRKNGTRRASESNSLAASTDYYLQIFLENARKVKDARAEAEACDMFDDENMNARVRSSKTFHGSGTRDLDDESGNGSGDLGGNGTALRRRQRGGGAARPAARDTGSDVFPLLSPTLCRVPTPTEQIMSGLGDVAAGQSMGGESSGGGGSVARMGSGSGRLRKPTPVQTDLPYPSSPTHQRVPTPTDDFEDSFFDERSGAERRTLRQRRGGDGLDLEVAADPFGVNVRDRVPSMGRSLVGDNESREGASEPEVGPDAFNRILSRGRALE